MKPSATLVGARALSRRRGLQAIAALGFAFVARPLQSSDQRAGDAGGWCGTGKTARPLFVPRDQGYLGRLELQGAPLSFAATRSGSLPRGITHGPLAFRTRHRGHDYVNPTLVLRRGERVRIKLANRIDEPTITHWHGLSVDERTTATGSRWSRRARRYEYDFEVRDRGALYWYHPHPHGSTARQTYGGMFGLIDVEDGDQIALREALDLTPGSTELALTLQDRRADPAYSPTPADMMHGFFGDELCINGTPCAYHNVSSRVYRLRMVNACNARTLRLAFRTASGARVPFTVDRQRRRTDCRRRCASTRRSLATAERLDVLLDLRDARGRRNRACSRRSRSIRCTTRSADARARRRPRRRGAHADMAARAGHHAHAHAHHAGAVARGCSRERLLALRVRERVRYERTVPATLSAIAPIDVAGARERPFRFGYNKGRWRINDRVFAMGETPIEVARDTTEVWLLRNYHTSMPHAMHLHGFHFEVLERETSPEFVRALAIDPRAACPPTSAARTRCWCGPAKACVSRSTSRCRCTGPQTYMFHCHNLEHEDGGMMVGVRVA